jgi:histidine ammonia-lyase
LAVVINGKDLTIEEVVRVAREYEQVSLAPEAEIAIGRARAYVEKKVAEGAVIYGLTTGFGKFQDTFVRPRTQGSFSAT